MFYWGGSSQKLSGRPIRHAFLLFRSQGIVRVGIVILEDNIMKGDSGKMILLSSHLTNNYPMISLFIHV